MAAFEKHLTEFERMFLFLSDELDFKQLSEMAEEVEQYNRNKNRNKGDESGDNCLSLNITDMYGFIRDKSQAVQ